MQIALLAWALFGLTPHAGAPFNPVPGALPYASWYRAAPIRVFSQDLPMPAWAWPAFVALGLGQSVALWALYRRVRARGLPARARAAVVAAALGMAALATSAPVATSADAYAYVGYGLAPSFDASIHTEHLSQAPGFEIINDMYGLPLIPNVYGVGLYAVMGFVRVAHVPLVADLYALRALGLWAFGAILWLLRGRLTDAALATLALCPALYLDWIVDSHNDVFAILAIVAGLRLMRARPLVAVVVASAAPLIKVSLLLVAISIAAVRANVRERVAAALAIGALSTGAFLACDGAALLTVSATHLGSAHGSSGGSPTGIFSRVPHDAGIRAIMVTAIVCTLAVAVIGARAAAGNALLFSAIAPAAWAWYLPWGIPYAALAPNGFAFVPIVLPLLTALTTLQTGPRIPNGWVLWGAALASACVFALRRRYERTAAPA